MVNDYTYIHDCRHKRDEWTTVRFVSNVYIAPYFLVTIFFSVVVIRNEISFFVTPN